MFNPALPLWMQVDVRKPCYEKSVKDWVNTEIAYPPCPGPHVPEELELTVDDLIFLANCEVVKPLLERISQELALHKN